MASLTSSRHSSSLTFVSSVQNQQPSARPLSTPSQSNSRRFALPSRAKMAKIGALLFVVLLLVIVVGIVIGDGGGGHENDQGGNNGNGRSRHLRAKSLGAKKKKLNGGLRQRPEEIVTEQTQMAEPETLGENGHADGEVHAGSTTTTSPRSKSRKTSRSHPTSRPDRESSVSANTVVDGCGECDPSACKNVAESSCQAGLVMDKCSCCMVCGTGEGSRCYNASIPNLSYNSDVGVCGTGLACILRKDLDPNEPREALCECRDRRLVCGNDNQTYISECKLREAAHLQPGLAISSWGPCVSAPWMPSSVENITVLEGEDASLSCEVKGFPSPVIHWEFLSTVENGAPMILPGDDSSVVVTVRGGPEKMMSTSWIQIISVTHERQGIYHCVATNSEGVARSLAGVTIQGAPSSASERLDS